MRNLSLTLAVCLLCIVWDLSAEPMPRVNSTETEKAQIVQKKETSATETETEQKTHEATHVIQQRTKSSVKVETRGWDIQNKEPIEEKTQ